MAGGRGQGGQEGGEGGAATHKNRGSCGDNEGDDGMMVSRILLQCVHQECVLSWREG